jgi:membrane protein CcdC involved in cytochrome C biogenesis
MGEFTLGAAVALKGLDPDYGTIKNIGCLPPIFALLQTLYFVFFKPFFKPSELVFVELFKLDALYDGVLPQSCDDL